MNISTKAVLFVFVLTASAINTIKSIMNVDLHNFGTAPNVEGKCSVGGYSGKAVKPIALRFISDLKKNPATKDAPLSGMGGIETWRDAAEFIAMGCETIQVTTAIMQYGYRIIDDMLDGLADYLRTAGMTSIRELVGDAIDNVIDAGVSQIPRGHLRGMRQMLHFLL